MKRKTIGEMLPKKSKRSGHLPSTEALFTYDYVTRRATAAADNAATGSQSWYSHDTKFDYESFKNAMDQRATRMAEISQAQARAAAHAQVEAIKAAREQRANNMRRRLEELRRSSYADLESRYAQINPFL